MFYKPEYRWRATYETAKGTPYSVDDTEIDECPVSFVSPYSAELVGSLEMARQVRESTGESPLPPVSCWPVKLVDTARLIAIEKIRQDNARIDAEESER